MSPFKRNIFFEQVIFRQENISSGITDKVTDLFDIFGFAFITDC